MTNDKIHPAPQEFSAAQLEADPVLRYFHFAHLPEPLRSISESFCTLAGFLVAALPRNPERTVALRKLLEAKDAGVRANVGVAPKQETFEDRLRAEANQLEDKLTKLGDFINGNPAFGTLGDKQRTLMQQQYSAMQNYLDALTARMDVLGLNTPVSLDHDAGDRDEILETRVTGGGSSETPIPFAG